MKKIKVLYFVDRLRHGGIQQLAVEMAKKMPDDVQMDFLVLNDGITYPLEDSIKELGLNLYKVDAWINNITDYINYYRKLNEFFAKHNDYNAIHINTSSKNFLILKLAKKYNIPIRIAHSHNTGFQTRNKIKILVGDVFKPLLKRYATHFFACSKIAGEWLFGKKSVDKGKVIIIHNAVDYDKYKFDNGVRNRIRKELDIEDKLVIGNVGRFTIQKNHTLLIDIFKEIYIKNEKSILMLVGVGEKEDETKQKVKDLGLQDKVLFLGYRNNVNELMQAMDVFVMPSLYEGLPVVGIEAQASGIPCFMSKDVITNEVKIAKNVKFIPLDNSAEKWAEIILDSD